MEETKKCPYCGEEILAVAKKCKHCGEWLNNVELEVKKETKPCPVCGEQVELNAKVCPHCNENLQGDSQDTPKSSSFKLMCKNVVIDTLSYVRNNFIFIIFILCWVVFFMAKNHFFTNVIDLFIDKGKKELSEKNAIPTFPRIGVDDPFSFGEWKGSNSINKVESEDGITYSTNITFNTTKSYSLKQYYSEEGVCIVDAVITSDNMLCEVEYTLYYSEHGSIKRTSEKYITEKPTVISCKKKSTVIKRNDTPYNDEELSSQISSTINSMIREIESSKDETIYKINKITKEELVLEELENNLPTGVILSYTRK